MGRTRGTRLAASVALAAVLSGAVVTTGASQEAIKINGSTGVAPLIAALAKAYQPRAPGVVIEIGGGLGGKERIEALSADKIAIAIASHGPKVDELTQRGMAVVEIARSFHRILKVDELLPKVLDSLFHIFPQAARGFILVEDEASGELVPRAVKSRGESDETLLPMSQTVVSQALEKRHVRTPLRQAFD